MLFGAPRSFVIPSYASIPIPQFPKTLANRRNQTFLLDNSQGEIARLGAKSITCAASVRSHKDSPSAKARFCRCQRTFLKLFSFFCDLGVDLLRWEDKNEEIFDNELDFYETEIVFIRGLRLPLRGGYKAQAQLIIDVYPSQDNPTNQTLWIFSGSSTAGGSDSIRTGSGSNSHANRDSWEISTSNNSGNIFDANKPSDVNFSLSPLFSSSNIKDIHSVSNRIPGGVSTNTIFAASATNTPTITIASGSRTISHLFLDEDSGSDDMGIRVSGSAFSYSSGQSSAWTGAGIINKPIGDFFAGTFNNRIGSFFWGPHFAAQSNGSVQVRVNSQVIPEPEEYALIFALFALGFVFFHRRMRKKRQAQATPTS